MRKKLLSVLLVLAMLFMWQSAFAAVSTAGDLSKKGHTVYVTGNDDFYPIEYYSDKTARYEGVIPEVLKRISNETGLDFTYLRNGTLQENVARSGEVQIVSAYIDSGDEDEFIKNFAEVLTYNISGVDVKVGLGFTAGTDTELINTIKAELARISTEEIKGYLITADKSLRNEKDDKMLVVTLFLILILLVTLLIFVRLMITGKKVQENSVTDIETGLGNLVYFENSFEKIIDDDEREKYYVAYIIIDTNYLQLYHNETTMLDSIKHTAQILERNSNEDDFAARITENGFAFAYKCTDEDDAKERLNSILKEVTGFLEKRKKPVFYASFYNLEKEDTSCGLLLFNLRKNCSVLVGGDKQVAFCEHGMIGKAMEEKIFLENISNAFDKHEFKLYIQFIVDNKTKKIVSSEALSRWHREEGELLMPGKYIGIMEENGLISKFDYYMFERVCRNLHKWKDTEFNDITMSCNFTRITISEPDFVDNIEAIARRYVFDRSNLIIEITEDAIEKNVDIALRNVLKCKELGFKTALDDLGCGYTSLINLCEYPIDIVKIDRDILLKTGTDSGKALFKGIVAMAKNLNLTVVCEGVETEEQNALAGESSCDMIQGFYYFKPQIARDAEEKALEYMKK